MLNTVLIVHVAWRLGGVEGALLSSHKFPSLIEITNKRFQLRRTMPKWEQHDSAVKATAVIQDRAVLELQLNSIQALLYFISLQHMKNKSRSRTS